MGAVVSGKLCPMTISVNGGPAVRCLRKVGHWRNHKGTNLDGEGWKWFVIWPVWVRK